MSMSTKGTEIPVMVNGCNCKMGSAVIKAANSAGLQILLDSFGWKQDVVELCGHEIKIHAPPERERVLECLYNRCPNMIVVDYTVPALVNDNADLYCKVGVPFVMGTTGGDRDRLYKTVYDAKVYALISPQMAKQVVAFLASLDILAKQSPDVLSGCILDVGESYSDELGKLDTSSAAIISRLKKLRASFDDKIVRIHDPKERMMQAPVVEEPADAFLKYSLHFPHNRVVSIGVDVCGRTTYAEGTVDAVLFLAKKIKSKAEKRIYDMIDVLREGNLR